MAIAISIGVSLLIGVTVMFQTRYFWGKESNDNINTLNCTMTNLTSSFGTVGIIGFIVMVALFAFVAVLMFTVRGF